MPPKRAQPGLRLAPPPALGARPASGKTGTSGSPAARRAPRSRCRTRPAPRSTRPRAEGGRRRSCPGGAPRCPRLQASHGPRGLPADPRPARRLIAVFPVVDLHDVLGAVLALGQEPVKVCAEALVPRPVL